REMAVRAALGATRGRIVFQLLTESILLAVSGGALGVLFAAWSVRWVQVVGTKTVPRLQDIAIDGRVLLFTLVLSLLSGVLFGMAPALRASRLDLYATVKGGARRNTLRRLLVMSELALSVVLLIGAGLLIRSFARLENVPPGFRAANVLTFELTMAGRKYAD